MTEGFFGSCCLLVFIRALVLFSVLPLSNYPVLLAWKTVWALGLALICSAGMSGPAAVGICDIALEALAGIAVGLPVMLLLSSASIFGELFDTARGQSMAAIYDPASGCEQAQTGILCRGSIWLAILLAGGFDELLVQFDASLAAIPPGTSNAVPLSVLAERITRQTVEAMTGAFSVFLPFAGVMLVVDMAAGISGRIIPGLSTSSETFQIKTAVGMIMLFSVAGFGAPSLVRWFLMERIL